MSTAWSILYRGSLSSCNYECDYCPFAKTENSREELCADEKELRRFADWVMGRPEKIGLLFTPWGEALVHRYYQTTLAELSHRPNVTRVAIQTNLSGRLHWLPQANPEKLALWCTFHPSQTRVDRFLQQCRELSERGIRYSVGLVGTKEALEFVEVLRGGLDPSVYFWINALKRSPDYYSDEEIKFLTGVDPLFPINNQRHPSRGKACRTGHTVFSVDGAGGAQRCHFVKSSIGNIYQPGFEKVLSPSPCPAETCGCHIGYVHLEELGMNRVFGPGILERIPAVIPI